jgi:hypothetical protein
MGDDVHHADTHAGGSQIAGFSIRRHRLGPFRPCRNGVASAFWNFGDETRGQYAVVLLLLVIHGLALQNVDITVLLRYSDGADPGFFIGDVRHSGFSVYSNNMYSKSISRKGIENKSITQILNEKR